MNGRPVTETEISQALRAHLPKRAQAGLHGRILVAVDTTVQQRALPSLLGVLQDAEPGARRRNMLIAAALVVALAIAAAAAAGAWLPQREVPPDLSLLPPADLQVLPSPRASAPSAAPTSSPVAQSLELTWTKLGLVGRDKAIAWLGDRFVLIDKESGDVSTSTDGLTWRALDPDPGYVDLLRDKFVTWGSDVVGWWNPEDGPDYTNKPPITARDVLQILRPPAAPSVTTPFKGRIESIGFGPAGIVAHVHSHLDTDAWIASKLGDDWVSRYEEVSFKDGILEITMKRGRGLKVVWADQGFEPGDFMGAGFGWYSPDGEQWTLMPAPAPSPDGEGGLGFVTGFGGVVGVSDGFIARGRTPEEESCSLPDGCGDMWHSSDGLTWRNLGPGGPEIDSLPVVLPWMGGALVTDGVGRFDFWTSQGYRELPMAEGVRAASKQPNEPYDNAIGTGPFGAAMVSIDNQEILVTRDGIDWDIQPMPAEMAADGAGRRQTTVAVGERSVLVLVWAGAYTADQVPSLWLGTPEP